MRNWFLLPFLFLALFFVYPLSVTLAHAGDGTAWRWLLSDYARSRLAGAAGQATISTLATLLVAIPLAWHHHRQQIPWSRLQMALHAAPFVLPVFVIVAAVRELLGPNGWLGQATGTNMLLAVGPLGAVVLAHVYYNYGFAARVIHAALERRPQQMEQIARTLGATPMQAFARTSLPLLAPALASVALLVWLFCFSSFGVVLLLGQGTISTPETMIYQQLAGAFPRTSRAAVLGVTQLLINGTILVAMFTWLRRSNRLPAKNLIRPAASRTSQSVGLALTALALLPILAVLAGGFQLNGSWSLEPWRAILSATHPAHVAGFELVPVVARTLGYAVGSATISLALAATLGWWLRSAGKLGGAAEAVAAIPLGTSSVLLGLGYLLAFGAGSWLDLRGVWIAMVIVHALIGFPFSARVLLPAMAQYDSRMDEAAILVGATPSQLFWRVRVPLLRGPIVAAAGFAAAMSIGDFGASLLLARRDTMGLAVWIGEHDQPFQALMHSQSVALTGLLMCLAAAAIVAIERFGGRAVWRTP